MTGRLDAAAVLATLRPLVIVVDAVGGIRQVHGGNGGFLGHDPSTFVGGNVFDFVAPSSIGEVATYFAESVDETIETVLLPLPFRLELVGADGLYHPVDIIPTAVDAGDGSWGWVVTIVPVAFGGAAARSLHATVNGSPRAEIRRLLADEVTVDNTHYSTRGFLIDRMHDAQPRVTARSDREQPMAEALADGLASGWRPWDDVGHGATIPVPVDTMPTEVRRLAADKDWQRVSVTPVHLDGVPIAAYVLFSRVPASHLVVEMKTILESRMRRLADYTALLVGRWVERERLLAAATHDALTGLKNRAVLASALEAGEGADASLLYIDVDDFKEVNDRHGHTVGDLVLVEIARRIGEVCRPDDVVARFGGDEFVVLLRGIGLDQATIIGTRILASVGAPIEIPGGSVQVTVSIGLAPAVGDADLIDLADRAMLVAKREGRARLVAAPPTP